MLKTKQNKGRAVAGRKSGKDPQDDNKNQGAKTPVEPKEGEAKDEAEEVEVKDLADLVTQAVKDAVGDSTSMKAEDIVAALKDDLTKSIKEAIESGKQVADAKPGEKDSKVPTKELMDVVKGVLDEHFRRASKAIHDPNEGRIETPLSWSKGNLPVHGKQLLNCLLRKPMNDGISESQLKAASDHGARMLDRFKGRVTRDGIKALTSTGSGTGDELVPTDLSSEINRRMYLESDLYAMLAATEIDMPTQPYDMPLFTTRPTYKLEATENTTATASTPGTAKSTLNAKKLMALVQASYEVDEDSIIPVLPNIQTDLAAAAGATFESCIINGDTAATHQDSDTHAITKAPEKGFDGLRKLALAIAGLKVSWASGDVSTANVLALKSAMGKYGVRPRDLLLVCGVNGFNDLIGLTEVLTQDKLGPNATILSGTLAQIFGIPIVVSEACRENLNASGVYDGSTTTKGSMIMFNKRDFYVGRRRDFTIEVDRNIKDQTHDIVASFRRAFTAKETPSATITSVALAYNYAA